MASAFSHIVLPLALMAGCGRARQDWRLLIIAMICAVLPDLDVVAFELGIPYASPWGHRGFTHSIMFALLLAGLIAARSSWLRSGRRFVFGVVFAATASHAILDALTNGGLGVALFWPFSNERYFLPWQVVEVSPIGIRRFFSDHGLAVVRSEILWIWLPAASAGWAIWLGRRIKNRKV